MSAAGTPLHTIVAGQVWCTQQAVKFGPTAITTRATFVKLGDGTLWVHSPVRPTTELADFLAELGQVRYVVAPNTYHHLFFKDFLTAFPGAQGFVAPGLAGKHSNLGGCRELDPGCPSIWPELQGIFVDGIPAINETVWLHPATGTLIVSDLLFCFGPDNGVLARLFARMLGVYGRLGMSRTMRLLVKDKVAFSAFVRSLLKADITRVVTCHDQIIDQGVSEQLTAAFQWLQE